MRRLQRGGLILGAGILALILIAVPVSQNWFRKPPELANLARLDRLQMACRLFAADHSGRYPTHLEAVSPEYLTAEALEDSRYQVIERQKGISVRLDWLYFGTGFEDTRLPRVLIAAPQFIDNAGQKSRIYLGGDGQSRIAPEEEYQKELAETVRELQEMMKRRSPPSSSPSLQRTQPE